MTFCNGYISRYIYNIFLFFNRLFESFNDYTIYNVKDEKLQVKRGLYFFNVWYKEFWT